MPRLLSVTEPINRGFDKASTLSGLSVRSQSRVNQLVSERFPNLLRDVTRVTTQWKSWNDAEFVWRSRSEHFAYDVSKHFRGHPVAVSSHGLILHPPLLLAQVVTTSPD